MLTHLEESLGLPVRKFGPRALCLFSLCALFPIVGLSGTFRDHFDRSDSSVIGNDWEVYGTHASFSISSRTLRVSKHSAAYVDAQTHVAPLGYRYVKLRIRTSSTRSGSQVQCYFHNGLKSFDINWHGSNDRMKVNNVTAPGWTYAANRWYLVECFINGSTVDVHIDGVPRIQNVPLNDTASSFVRLGVGGVFGAFTTDYDFIEVTSSRINDGLVGYWPLDGDFRDHSTYGNHGIEHGNVSFIDGRHGKAAVFDQRGSKYVEVLHQPQYIWPSGFTISFWFKPGERTGDGGRYILSKHEFAEYDHGNAWSASWAYWAHDQIHKLFFTHAWEGSPSNYEHTSHAFAPGAWIHQVYTYSPVDQQVRTYIDGSLASQQEFSHLPEPIDTTLSLLFMHERSAPDGSRDAEGVLDEVRLYDRALSSDEVRGLFSGNYQQQGVGVQEGQDNSTQQTTANIGGDGTFKCSGTGMSPVAAKNGHYRLRADDAVLPTRGLPLQITRFYNSIDEYDGPFSHGWCFNQTVQLVQTADDSNLQQVVIRWANGVRKDFTLTNGVYQASLSCYDTLTTNGIGFLLEMPSGMELRFNQGGFLVSQTERNGNAVTYEHDLQNRISRVTSADGRTLDYHYNPTNNRASKIQDWAGRAWQYGYSTNDDLVSVTYPNGSIIRYTYDSEHNLTGTYDARSNLVSSLTYDADADKTTSYAEGAEVSYSFAYDSASNTTYKTDSQGRPWSFRYNQYGNKENLVDPAGQEVQFTWTGSQEISSKTDPRGYPQHFEYDSRGNVISVSNVLGHVTRYTYETNFNQVTSITDPLGNVVSNRYDAYGNLIWSQDARSFVTEFHYDSFGQLTNAVDARSQATAMTYNPHGELLNVTDPLGNSVSYTYDERGNRLTMTDARWHTWHYGYDIMDRLVSITNPLGHATSYAYDPNGNRASVTDARTNMTRFAYDEYNRLFSVTNALGIEISRTEYDIYGQVVAVSDALGNSISNTYDILNRPVTVTDPLGNPTSFSYDENGNRTAVTDAMTNSTRYAFDPLNRMVSMTNAVGGVWEYAYDANHNLLAVTDARDKTSENQYDVRNMVTNSANAMGHAYRYTHDGTGNVIERTDPNGATLVYSYDEANRLTSIAYPNGTALAFSHDENGNVTVLSNATETVRYAYDPLNRVTNVLVVGLNKAIAYEYDAVGNRAAMIDPDGGRMEYEYDALNRLTALTDPGSNTWMFAYDAINRMTNMSMPNGTAATYQYDPGSRLTNLVYRSSTNAVLQSFAYAYDAAGNPLSVKREDNLYELYQYDDIYQLTRVDYDGTNAVDASTNWTEYVYDLVGNRLTHTREGETETYEYDDANRLLSVTSASSLVTFGWDDNGNMTNTTENGTNTFYAWDYENKLVRITYHDGSTNAFAYYPSSSLRHTKVDSGETNRFVYDGQNLLQELDGLGTLVAQYQYSLGIDSLLARTAGGNQQYYLRDMIGSVTAVADADEDLLATYRYDAFGTVRRETGAADNPYLFTSRRLDQDSGLYYYRARYMAGGVGRFVSFDPMAQETGYDYVRNNPVARIDPRGLFFGVPSFWQMFGNSPLMPSPMLPFPDLSSHGAGCQLTLSSASSGGSSVRVTTSQPFLAAAGPAAPIEQLDALEIIEVAGDVKTAVDIGWNIHEIATAQNTGDKISPAFDLFKNVSDLFLGVYSIGAGAVFDLLGSVSASGYRSIYGGNDLRESHIAPLYEIYEEKNPDADPYGGAMGAYGDAMDRLRNLAK